MVTRVFAAALMMVTAATVSFAQVSSRETTKDPASVVPRAVQENVAVWVLRKHVDSADFVDQTFEDVLEWVREQGPLNVVPQLRALEAEGVTLDALVNLQLRDTTVADVLNGTLEQLSEQGSLGYRASGNTLKISTKSDFNRKLELRVYDVTDILVRVPDFRDAPEIDIQQQQTGGGGAGGQGGAAQQLFGGAGGGGGEDEEEDQRLGLEQDDPAVIKLRELIEDTVAPETWDSFGGQGSIRPFGKGLVVRNSIEVHEMIAGTFSFK